MKPHLSQCKTSKRWIIVWTTAHIENTFEEAWAWIDKMKKAM